MISALLAAAALQATAPTKSELAAVPPPAAPAKAHDPDKVVCTTEKEIGSLFSHRVCVHKSVLDERRQNDREILDKNQRGPLCTPGQPC